MTEQQLVYDEKDKMLPIPEFRCAHCGHALPTADILSFAGKISNSKRRSRSGPREFHTCSWCGKERLGTQELKEHKLVCDQRPPDIHTGRPATLTYCRFCGQAGGIGEIKVHEAGECLKRPVACRWCKRRLQACHIKSHERTCPRKKT